VGLCIALKDEFGKQIDFIADEKNILDRLLGSPDESTFPMLASIDRYGDTTFNQMQIDRFLAEWESLFSRAETSEEKELLLDVKRLGETSRRKVHQYLVFIGD
jgi:hypothetical protein